jgi:hypothetical protein
MRLDPHSTRWQFINPGESLDLEDKEEWTEIKEEMADVSQALFYEVIGTGTTNLDEATSILRQHDPTLMMKGRPKQGQERE